MARSRGRGTGSNLRLRSTVSRGGPEIVLPEKLEQRHINYFTVSAIAVNKAIDSVIAKLPRVFPKELRTDDKADDLIESATRVYLGAISMGLAKGFVTKTNAAVAIENKLQWKKQIAVEVNAKVKPKARARKLTDILYNQEQGIPKAVQRAWIRQQLSLIRVEGTRRVPSIPDKAFEQLSKIIRDAIERGSLVNDVANELKHLRGVNLRRAKTLASDQILSYHGRMTKIRHENIGVSHYIWRTSGDEAVRESHKKRNGKRYPYKNPKFPTSDSIDGSPGEPVR